MNDLEQPIRTAVISETIIHRSPVNDRDEHQEQAAVIGWARQNEHKYPKLEKLFAIPNGGLRDARVGQKLKQEGVRPGVPDLCLPVKSRNFNGLYIEMKATRNGNVSAPQKEWLLRLGEEGYAVAICFGADAAINVLEQYLNG